MKKVETAVEAQKHPVQTAQLYLNALRTKDFATAASLICKDDKIGLHKTVVDSATKLMEIGNDSFFESLFGPIKTSDLKNAVTPAEVIIKLLEHHSAEFPDVPTPTVKVGEIKDNTAVAYYKYPSKEWYYGSGKTFSWYWQDRKGFSFSFANFRY